MSLVSPIAHIYLQFLVYMWILGAAGLCLKVECKKHAYE